MALIFENGTGVQDANAYVNIPYIEMYFIGEQLAQFNALSGSDKDAAIIRATQFIDISYEWLGTRKASGQGLNWPRAGVELDGWTVEGIPVPVKRAVCEAVWLIMTEENLFSTDNDKEVVRERVEGAVDVTYANPKDKTKETVTKFEILDKMLRGLYRTEEAPSGGSSVGVSRVERV